MLVDCVLALGCLEVWSGGERAVGERMRRDVEEGGKSRAESGVGEETGFQPSSLGFHASDAPRKSTPTDPSTSPRAPLLHHPRTRNILLTTFDMAMLSILASHIATYFASLRTALAFCSHPMILTSPVLPFGETKFPLSFHDRCVGLNVDIHVAGGFAVFMALVLGVLHVVALGARGWGYVQFGWEGGAGDVFMSSSKVGEVVESGEMESTDRVSAGVTGLSAGGLCNVSSTDGEKSSACSRFMSCCEDRPERIARRRTDGTDETRVSQGDAKWSEVFLECLIDV